MTTGTILNWMWGALGLYWLGAALRTKKSATDEAGALRILRLLILAVTFILLLSNWLRIGPLAWRFVPETVLGKALGIGLTAAGILLCVWARLHLGRYWSDRVVLKVDHQLIRNGPYAYVRHPIYSGVLLGIAGTALAIGEWRGVVALAVLGINYSAKAKREERILASSFGAVFTEYKRKTGFLLPGL